MSLTVNEIREHANLLQGRLEYERLRLDAGDYSNGHPRANLELIEALEGRVAELLKLCDTVEARQTTAAVLA